MNASRAEPPSLLGTRVLIVEDEGIIAQDIELSLKPLGYEVCGVTDSGPGAIQQCGELLPDVVLMDINLRGEMDGIEAARVIYQRHRIPIVFLTAYADEATLRRAETTEPFGYVLKPFEERELHASLIMALCRHRAYAEIEERIQERTSELARSEARFRLLVESVKDYAIAALDPRGYVSSWNSGAESTTGYQASEILGQHFSYFYSREDQEAGVPARVLQVAAAEGRLELEGWRLRKDGSWFWANGSISAIRDSQQRLLGYAVVTRDLTVRKRAEELLRESLRLREDFIAIAAHELKTPLTSLKLQLSLLNQLALQAREQALCVPPDRLVLKTETMNRQLGRLDGLIENLLDLSRAVAGRLVLDYEDTSLKAVVEEVLERFAENAVKAQCPVTMTAEGACEGVWDRQRLDQIVTNLLSNALKYGSGKPVELQLRCHGDTVSLKVKDLGIGISPEDHGRIFERFERAVSSQHFGGFGLGLWIVKQLVTAMGGTISVQSTPGQGSEFIVHLPKAPSAEHGAPAAQAQGNHLQ